MTKRLILTAAIGSMGGLVFGYDLGAISSASQNLRQCFALSPSAFGLTISASLWGTVGGSLLAGLLADRLGRKPLISLCAFLYALAAIALAAPIVSGWYLVLGLRSLGGLAIGGFTVACPLYLAEISPKEMRGRLVSLFQVQVSIGVVGAFTLGALLLRLVSSGVYWRWCLGMGALPAVALLALATVLPPASRSHAGELSKGAISTAPARERLFQRKYLRPLLWATSIAVFNQLSGANILVLYLLDVLSSAGFGHLLGHTYTVWVSGFSLAFTLIGLSLVDRWGRKPLLILGSAGMFVCLALLAAAIPRQAQPIFFLLILTAYNLFFAFSQGTVVWVYLSELFPAAVRGTGQGYGTTIHWIVNASLIWLFPISEHAAPSLTFYALALLMLVQISVVWLWYPETKGTILGSVAVHSAAWPGREVDDEFEGTN